LRAAGIEAMHLRIGCRVNGAFLECVNDDVTVLINGIPRNRARLANGDRIKIGVVELDVEMPDAPKKQSFSVSFEDEGSESRLPGMKTISGVLRSEEQDDGTSEQGSESDGIGDNSGDELADENERERNETTPSVQSAGDHNESESSLTTIEIDEPIKPKAQEGKAVFEFDSVGIEDADFTSEDLEAIAPKEKAIPSKDDTVEIDEDFFASRPNIGTPDNNDVPKPELKVDPVFVENEVSFVENEASDEPVDESCIPGGSPQGGKCWRWSGSSEVASALDVLEERPEEFVWYEVNEHTELLDKTPEEIRQALSERKNNAIYVLSAEKPDEVVRYLVAKRWSDRMRHPEALSMSLSILPARHVAALFYQIDTVLLIQKSDTSLIRLNNS
jgi:hypothetical protein